MNCTVEPAPRAEIPNPVDKLLAKLSEQSAAISKQTDALKEDGAAYRWPVDYVSTGSSIPSTPAEDTFNQSMALITSPPSLASDTPSAEELLRLKLELEAAKGKIALMDQELAQSRITKHTIDQAIGPASETDFPIVHPVEGDPHFHTVPSGLHPVNHSLSYRDGSWAAQDDARSDTSDALSASGFNRARAIWSIGDKPHLPVKQQGLMQNGFQQPSGELASAQYMSRSFGQPFVDASELYPRPQPTSCEQRVMPDPDMMMAPPSRRANAGPRFSHRNISSLPYLGSSDSYDSFTPASTPFGSLGAMGSGPSMGIGMNIGGGVSNNMTGGTHGVMYGGYQPQPVGTLLSPHAPEFNVSGSIWKSDVSVLHN